MFPQPSPMSERKARGCAFRRCQCYPALPHPFRFPYTKASECQCYPALPHPFRFPYTQASECQCYPALPHPFRFPYTKASECQCYPALPHPFRFPYTQASECQCYPALPHPFRFPYTQASECQCYPALPHPFRFPYTQASECQCYPALPHPFRFPYTQASECQCYPTLPHPFRFPYTQASDWFAVDIVSHPTFVLEENIISCCLTHVGVWVSGLICRTKLHSSCQTVGVHCLNLQFFYLYFLFLFVFLSNPFSQSNNISLPLSHNLPSQCASTSCPPSLLPQIVPFTCPSTPTFTNAVHKQKDIQARSTLVCTTSCTTISRALCPWASGATAASLRPPSSRISFLLMALVASAVQCGQILHGNDVPTQHARCPKVWVSALPSGAWVSTALPNGIPVVWIFPSITRTRKAEPHFHCTTRSAMVISGPSPYRRF